MEETNSVNSPENPDLTVTTEVVEPCVLQMTIEVPEERVQAQMRRSARQIAQRANIPGFRKGKAPYDVIVQRYGEEMVRYEAAEALIEEVYREALQSRAILPYDSGQLVKSDLEPLVFTFTVPLQPQVKLGDYRSLRLKPSKIKVAKEEVKAVLEQLRQDNAVLEPVGEREARPGDQLDMAVVGRREDGSVFMRDQVEKVLDLEDNYPVPGFYQALVGMRVDEERQFSLPKPGSEDEEYEFTVTLRGLYGRTLPEIDDDLARAAGNFDNLKALEKDVKQRIAETKQAEADREYRQQIVDKLVAQATVEYPPVMFEDEMEHLLKDIESNVRRETRLSLQDYLVITHKTEAELRDELRPQGEERLRRSLVLLQLVEEEQVNVTPEEVAQYIEQFVQPWGEQAETLKQQLSSGESRLNLFGQLQINKAVDRLVAFARGEGAALEVQEEE